MVHAIASVEDLESGYLPSVCAKTGEPATGFSTVRISHLPGWTWILLLFGIWPFLIAWFFATRRIDAKIPMSDLALRRVRTYTTTYVVVFTVAVVLLGIGLFTEHPTVSWFGLLTAFLGLAVIIVGWFFVYPTGRFLDQNWISLSAVDERFATAVDRWYGEARLGAGAQSGGRAGGKPTNWTAIVMAAIVTLAVLYFLSAAYCSKDTESPAASGPEVFLERVLSDS